LFPTFFIWSDYRYIVNTAGCLLVDGAGFSGALNEGSTQGLTCDSSQAKQSGLICRNETAALRIIVDDPDAAKKYSQIFAGVIFVRV
jgi:hypothetical protein